MVFFVLKYLDTINQMFFFLPIPAFGTGYPDFPFKGDRA